LRKVRKELTRQSQPMSIGNNKATRDATRHAATTLSRLKALTHCWLASAITASLCWLLSMDFDYVSAITIP